MSGFARITALVAAAVCLLAGGCGDDEATPTTSSSPTASQPRSPDDIYNGCLEQLSATSVDTSTAAQTCGQARELYSRCRIEASERPAGARRESALRACDREADAGLAKLVDAAPG